MFRFILFIILTININIQASTKVICELEGTYSITYEDVTKNFLALDLIIVSLIFFVK